MTLDPVTNESNQAALARVNPRWPNTTFGPWKRKFAWRKTIVNGTLIWLKFYYQRKGEELLRTGAVRTSHQTAANLFDMLMKS